MKAKTVQKLVQNSDKFLKFIQCPSSEIISESERQEILNFLQNLRSRQTIQIHKRYSDFVTFKEQAFKENPHVFFPSMPPKKISANLNMHDEVFIMQRKEQLEVYLNKLLTNADILNLNSFKMFLQQVCFFIFLDYYMLILDKYNDEMIPKRIHF